MKRKLLRANHSSYISKSLQKAIMRRSHLEKSLLQKTNLKKSFKAYKENRKTLADCIKKKGNGFFNNLNPSFCY